MIRPVARRAWPWLRLLLGAAILAALVWRLGTSPFTHGLHLVVDGRAILLAVLLGFGTTVVSAWRWCLVAQRIGLSLQLRTAIVRCYCATFLNAVLPGGVLGDVDRAVRHGRDNGDLGRGARAVILERTANQIVVITAGVMVLLAQPRLRTAAFGNAMPVAAAVALCVIAAVVALIALAWRSPRWHHVLTRTTAEVRRGLLSPDTFPAVVLMSIAALAGHLTLFVVAARVAGATAPTFQLLPLLLLALLAMGLPTNVGGWGPREGMAALAFAAAGLGAAQGLTVAVIYGALTFVSALPGGGLLLLHRIWPARRLQIELEQHVLAEGDATHGSP